jgi:hypothetical protein
MTLNCAVHAMLLATVLHVGWERDVLAARTPVRPPVRWSDGGPTIRVQADSIAIDVRNDMPHPMALFYEVDGIRKPLGSVEAGGVRTVKLGGMRGDSVTLWATHDFPPHDLSRTFPTHTGTRLTWAF